MKLSVGQEIAGRFRVEQILGSGGTALVYLVRANDSDATWALKVLTVQSQTIRERMLREGDVQRRLTHLNLVHVDEVLDVEGNPGLLMEYVDGPSLENALGRYGLTLVDAETLFLGILAGVRAAHGLGLVHRDLKPANILLSRTAEGFVPKVTDFGLAKLVEGDPAVAQTRQGIAMGTPSYMAPEQIRDARSVDQRADLWSLGCLLYELCTRRRAFPGDEALAIYNAVVEGEFTPPRRWVPDLPKHLEQAIHGCLRVELGSRIPDCETLLEVLQGDRTWPIPDETMPDLDRDRTPILSDRFGADDRPVAVAPSQARTVVQPVPPKPTPSPSPPVRPVQRPRAPVSDPGGPTLVSISGTGGPASPIGSTGTDRPGRVVASSVGRGRPSAQAVAAMDEGPTNIMLPEDADVEPEEPATVIVARSALDGMLAPKEPSAPVRPAPAPEEVGTSWVVGGGLVALGLGLGLVAVLSLTLGVGWWWWSQQPQRPPPLPAPIAGPVPLPAPEVAPEPVLAAPAPSPAPVPVAPAPVTPTPVAVAPAPARPEPAPIVAAPRPAPTPRPPVIAPAPAPAPAPSPTPELVSVRIDTVPPGLQVQVAGNLIGKSPFETKVKPGRVPVAVISGGDYNPFMVDLTGEGPFQYCYDTERKTYAQQPCP